MILSAVNICYDPIHQPFASEGAVKIQNLNSQRSASKIIRAVLRDSDIDPQEAVNYSIHRCYCNSNTKNENQIHEAFRSESTLDELGIRDGDSILIRKIDAGEEKKKEQGSIQRRSSRKRKETEYKEDDDTGSLESTFISASTSKKRRATSTPPDAAAAVDKASSNLENLVPHAAATARSISKLLGGDGWKDQSIGKLGTIQTRGQTTLQGLLRSVKTSLKIPQLSKSGRSGLFNSDLVEALTRAYHQRVGSSRPKSGQRNFLDLGLSDYERANELLKGRIEDDESLGRSSISHLNESLNESSPLKPEDRFPLSDSGLSGSNLNGARAICVLWNNDKWVKQSPMPGLSPISLKDHARIPIVRQIAQLTRVKPGEATPDGFPTILLDVLRQAINQGENGSSYLYKDPRYGPGWSQTKAIALALKLLKARLLEEAENEASPSSLPSERRVSTQEESKVEARISKRMRIESVLC